MGIVYFCTFDRLNRLLCLTYLHLQVLEKMFGKSLDLKKVSRHIIDIIFIILFIVTSNEVLAWLSVWSEVYMPSFL